MSKFLYSVTAWALVLTAFTGGTVSAAPNVHEQAIIAVEAADGNQAQAPALAADQSIKSGELNIVILGSKKRVRRSKDGVSFNAGTTTYVARETLDGTQVLSVDTRADGPSLKHGYLFPGKFLELLSTGEVIVRDSEFAEPLAVIEPAWAKDAEGRILNTRYRVNGHRLYQIVDIPKDIVFPVVADPKVKRYWWGISFDFSETETRKIAAGGTTCAAVFGAAAAFVTGPLAPIVAGACGVAAGAAAYADAGNKCLSVRFLHTTFVPIPWSRKC